MSPIITYILIPLSQRQGTDTILRSIISDSVKTQGQQMYLMILDGRDGFIAFPPPDTKEFYEFDLKKYVKYEQ